MATSVRLKTRVCEQRPSWARSPVRVGRKGRAQAATPAPESLASMVQARRATSPVRVRPPTRRYHAAADGRLTARSRGAQSSSRRSVSPTSSVSVVSVSRPPSRSLVQAVPTRSPPASVATTVVRPSILGSSSPRLGAATEALVQTTRGDKSDLFACIAGDAPSVAVAEAPPPWAASSSRRSSGLGSLSAASREADAAPPPWCASQPDPHDAVPPEV